MPPVAPGSESSTALIAAIAAGDRDAFSRFYDLTAPMAFGLIRRVLRDPEAAAEVLQEVFWQVWQDAPRYDPKRGSPEAWLVMRAKTRAIDRLRSIRRRDRTFVAQVPEAQRRVIELAFLRPDPVGDRHAARRAARDREDADPPRAGSPARGARRGEAVGHMNRDEIDELAAAYALGGLEGEERVRFEALLEAGDPDAVRALRDCEDTLVGLAAGAPEAPPPAVKAALMERIAGTPAPVRTLPRRSRALWPVVLSGAMAAGLAAVVVGWSVSSTYEKRLDALA